MALSADRATAHKDTEVVKAKLAASTKVYGGGIAALNASGYAINGADVAGANVIGVFEEQVDNSSGSAGDRSAKVRRGKAFYFKNSATNAVAQAHLFTNVYVEDNETVSSDGGTNNIVAGLCVGFDSGGVYVVIE